MIRISKGQLEKLQKKYKTDEAIGNLFGVTRQAIHQIRAKHGVAPIANKHGERNREIVSLFEKGISGIRLSKKFKLSTSQVYRIIRHNGKR